MGRHRAPDSDEPADEPSDDFPPPEDLGDDEGTREPEGLPADPPQYTGSVPGSRAFPQRPPEFP